MSILARKLLVALLVVAVGAAAYVTVRWRYGAFDDVYRVTASLPRASQLLRVGTDVRRSGVVIGTVGDIRLADREVELVLEIEGRYRVPRASRAHVDLKTLLGDKFVDLRSARYGAPFLEDGARIPGHVGPEVEDVLEHGVEVLRAVDPTELSSVIHELARGARGSGEHIARGLEANAELSTTFRDTLPAQLRSVESFAVLFEELERRVGDLGALADALNEGVPVYASPEAQMQLRRALIALVPMAEDLADLLILERSSWDLLIRAGDRLLATLVPRIGGIRDLITGLGDYVFKLGGDPPTVFDGTAMAPFANFIGGEDFAATLAMLCGAAPPGSIPICEGLAP